MRLKLDWNIQGEGPRLKSIEDLANDPNLTNDNLETLADYILWQNEEPSKFGLNKWVKGEEPISLDEMQSQGVDPTTVSTPMKARKAKLNREAVKPLIQGHATESQWYTLWRQIDECEFGVQTWEASIGKRRPDLPIRKELYDRLAEHAQRNGLNYDDYLEDLRKAALAWDAYAALKAKRRLVQLRTEQYSLLDLLSTGHVQRRTPVLTNPDTPDKGILGFRPFMATSLILDKISDSHFEPTFYAKVREALNWADAAPESRILDLRDPRTMKVLLMNYEELESTAFSGPIENRDIMFSLYTYVNYYVHEARLDPIPKRILELKMRHMSNREIAAAILNEFDVTYSENYISTIFHNRVLDPILEEVDKHYRLLEYILMGKTVFKKCRTCGRLLPRNTTYFLKRKSCSDGFNNNCKTCEKERKRRKNSEKKEQ